MPTVSTAETPSATILVLTPTDGDAAAVCHVLNEAGFQSRVCADMAALAHAVAAAPAGIILAEEALTVPGESGGRMLASALKGQPEWSDVPIVLLATSGASEVSAWEHARALEAVGNISILERPLRRTTLLNAVAVALRARERQYRLRATLAQREEALRRVADEVAATTRIAEESQRVSHLLDALLLTAPVGFCFLNRDLRFVHINERLAETNGISAKAHLGRHVSEIVPALVEALRGVTDRILATGEAVLNHEFSGETPSALGARRFWKESWYPVRGGAGEILGFGGIVEEITERKEAEAELLLLTTELRESETRTRVATEATAVGIWEWNVLTDSIRWDAQMFRLYGIAPTPDGCVQYGDWSGAVLPEDLAKNDRILLHPVRRGGQSRREFRIRRRDDGRVRHIEAVETVRMNEDGQAEWVVGTNLDITEREAAQQELSRHREGLQRAVEQRTAELAASTVALHTAERLAALGTLAAGLGHDIANLTLPIRMRLKMLEASCTTDDTRKDFAAISKSLDHLSNLSAGMRLMAMDPEREQASTPAADLEAWCAETSQILRAAIPHHLHFQCQAPRGLGVNIPRHRLAQAVFNLVQNAGEAMAAQPDGTVRVTAEAATTAAGDLVVRVLVQDDGPGMPAEVVARCFEPYFSTKGRAIATGMGLGMVRGIVESAGGTVAVRSAPGEGTTFTLTFPAAVSGPSAAAGAARTAAVTIKGQCESSLAMMFLGQLALKTYRHLDSSAPDASLWVVEKPDPSMVREYLDLHPEGWVVVLEGGMDFGSADGGGQGTGHGAGLNGRSERVTVVGLSPSPAALRDAIIHATRASAPTAPGT